MAQVIGRVITGTFETVRGPDVVHRIAVDREWLAQGALVEFELPRNLTCAACEGGGCDRCGRSGAITLRERSEPTETVQLTLPHRSASEQAEQPSFVLRLPGHGGKDRPELGETRGFLLLRIVASDMGDPGVRRVFSVRPLVEGDTDAEKAESGPPSGARVRKGTLGVLAVLIVVGLVVAVLLSSALP